MKIIVQLQGGLGNQLFQYAAARALADQHGAQLELDTAWYEATYTDVTQRDVQLLHFQIEARIVCQKPLRVGPKSLRRIAQEFLPINPYVLMEKHSYTFTPKLSQLSLYVNQDLYLLGYWQSYKYFSHIRSELTAQIRPNLSLNSAYQQFSNLIQGSASAMVHIRRGDYVHLPVASKVHGFLGLEYYVKGMTLLLQEDSSIQFFVFSDDIAWARTNLPYQERTTFIEVAPSLESAPQELFLMSQCKSHLIANSSLSWWGAWLAHGESSEKKVICPTHWTNDRKMNWDDLLPKSWEKI